MLCAVSATIQFVASHEQFMARAIELASENVRQGLGGPFGAVVVKDGEVIATGVNQVTKANDPTAHAEIVAIRAACQVLGSFQLTGCTVYSSCEPCPMCMAALYWARPERVFYANTRQEAAAIGFDDGVIEKELALPPEARKLPLERLCLENALESFRLWKASDAKLQY